MADVQQLKNEIEQLKLMIQQGTRTEQRTLPQIPLPEPLDIKSGDISENFKNFRNQWELYLQATSLTSQNEETKKAILLTAIGNDVFRRYGNMPINDEEKRTAADLLNAIERNLTPSINKRYVRAIFNMAKQEEDETYDEYFNRLRGLIRNAQYGTLQDDLLLDKIICSIKDHTLRERLWLEKDITLDKAIEICRSKEVSEKQLRGLDNNNVEINKIQKTRNMQQQQNKFNRSGYKCKFCGNEYHDSLENCPARRVYCRKCDKKGHYARVCMADDVTTSNYDNNNKRRTNGKAVKIVSADDDEQDGGVEYVMNLFNEGSPKGLFRNLVIYNEKGKAENVKTQLDTGATCNVIGLKNLKYIEPNPQIRKTTTVLKAIEGNISTVGKTVLTVQHNNIERKLLFYVIKKEHCPLLSADACLDLKYIEICKTINKSAAEQEAYHIINKYKDVFKGLGKLNGKIKLEIDNRAIPKSEPPRRIPVALREQLKTTLDEMERMKVIQKEEEHTDWTSNIVIVKKNNNKLRICIDPKELNNALRDVKYQLPTVEEILTELSGAKVFSTLDAKNGFWQLQLDDQSSKLTTFWTPFGKYRFTRLPFGVKPAMEIFQMKQNEVVFGLKGVTCIADDILVVGKGENIEEATRDHNRNLQQLLERLRTENLKINQDKMRICQNSIKFFGHILTSEGLKPDPDKINAIISIPRPSNKNDTLRFLGIATYLSKFIPNLSEITEPLRRATHIKNEFSWNDEQEKAFINIKQVITTTPVLKYFDVTKQVTIQTDASSFALGCTLMQDGHPIIYASKTLTPTQRNYAQIEKEMLAILYACKRFDQYICGMKNVLIETDHSPLINIFKKPLLNTPKRLQSMILSLQRYNFNIKYTKGNQMYIADALSRAPMEEDRQEKSFEIYKIEQELKELDECNDIEHKRVSNEMMIKIQQATAQDRIMNTLIKTNNNGWPQNKSETDEAIRDYWNIRDELVSNNKMIFKGNRILVPQQLRNEILNRLHQPHLGIESTLKLARETVYWRGISDCIKRKIQDCGICNKYAKNQQKEPLVLSEIPRSPFEIVSMDICEATIKDKKKHFLITVDHYSDFFEIDELSNLSAKTTINICRKNFSRYGIPLKVITDNGTNFVNSDFVKFAVEWDFTHETSSTYHQQANGKAESAVKIAKQLIKKAVESNTDLYKSLLVCRNTPNKVGSSPAKRLFCRWLNCGIPNVNIEQQVEREVPQRIEQQRKNNKKYFDKGTRKENNLKEGDMIYMKRTPDDVWTKGEVKQKVSNRTCIISSNQKLYKRNTIHVKKPNNSTHTVNEDEPCNPDQSLAESSTIPSQQTITHQMPNESNPTDVDTQHTSRIIQNDSQPIEDVNARNNQSISRPRRQVKAPKRFEDYEPFQ